MAGLNSIIAVTSNRELKGKTSQETRYFISSLDATDPKRLGHIVRAQWGIESNLYWFFAFDEDTQRQRKTTLPPIWPSSDTWLLTYSKLSAKVRVKNKRLKAAWDNNDLLKLLSG